MFKKHIVIVIGAGASFDTYGLPLGGPLAESIAEATNFYWSDGYGRPSRGDADLFQSMMHKFTQDREAINRYTTAGQRLSAAISSAASVDDALYQLSDYPEAVQLGKVCIIRAILKAEGSCTLKISPEIGRPQPDAGRNGWIEQIFSMAITGLKESELERAFENVTFVNFNYDRCIEHYLFWAFQRIGLPEQRATNIVKALEFIRPYGTLGSILPHTPSFLQFGADRARLNPFAMTDRIRTFTESEALHDKEILSTALLRAEMILFLGFGFHPQNLELLTLPSDQASRRGKAIATTYKIHDANLDDLKLSLAMRLKFPVDMVEMANMTASGVLQQLRLKILMAVG